MRGVIINYVVYLLNYIPKEGQDLSPREMTIVGKKIEYQMMCRWPFGFYVQVHNDDQVTNTMEARTTGAIKLGSTRNMKVDHHFLNITTIDTSYVTHG
jgi:hypothetical protein